MYRIRYYDQFIHPDHFQKKGLRGFLIRVLNLLRWRLETLIQKLVLKQLTKDGGVEPAKVKVLETIFGLDVEAERLEKVKTSPNFLPFVEAELPDIIPSRSDKYAEGSIKSKFQSTQDKAAPPEPIGALAARYGGPRRTVRYARGRRFTLLDPDGDFKPVKIQGLGDALEDTDTPGLFAELKAEMKR